MVFNSDDILRAGRVWWNVLDWLLIEGCLRKRIASCESLKVDGLVRLIGISVLDIENCYATSHPDLGARSLLENLGTWMDYVPASLVACYQR
jgi:hypothetical protein